MGKKIKFKKHGLAEAKNKSKILSIVLSENKSAKLNWHNYNTDNFTLDGNTYFFHDSGTYLTRNKVLIGIYLEGISIPIGHQYIKKKKETRTFTDPITDKIKTVSVWVIEGLKLDSEIIDILLNRKLAEKFTRVKSDSLQYILGILGVVSIILLIVSIGVSYMGI